MDTQDIIQRLNELAAWSSDEWSAGGWQYMPRDLTETLYRAAATIGVLRDELKSLLDKEREI